MRLRQLLYRGRLLDGKTDEKVQAGEETAEDGGRGGPMPFHRDSGDGRGSDDDSVAGIVGDGANFGGSAGARGRADGVGARCDVTNAGSADMDGCAESGGAARVCGGAADVGGTNMGGRAEVGGRARLSGAADDDGAGCARPYEAGLAGVRGATAVRGGARDAGGAV